MALKDFLMSSGLQFGWSVPGRRFDVRWMNFKVCAICLVALFATSLPHLAPVPHSFHGSSVNYV